MAHKVIQIKIDLNKEVDFINAIEKRKKELNLLTDSSYVRYVLSQDLKQK